jgi:histone H3/H4
MAAESAVARGFRRSGDLRYRRLRRSIRALRLRVRLLIALRLAVISVAIVGGGAALAVAALRLRDIWYSQLAPEVALAAAVLASLCAGLLWPLSDRMVAASADRRLGLRDRIGSALHFLRTGARSGMAQAAILDALDHLGSVRPGEAFPVRRMRGMLAAGVCVAALALAQLLPIPALLLSPREQREKDELRQLAARIEPVAKELEEASVKADDKEGQQASGQLRKLGERLERGQMDKKQALLDMAKIEKQLQRLDQRLARPKTAEEAARSLQKAAQDSVSKKASELAQKAAERGDEESARELAQLAEQAKQTQDQSKLEDLSRKLEERAAKLGSPIGLPPDLLGALSESLAGANAKLSEQALKDLAEAAKNWPKELSEEELKALAAELKELSKLLEGSDLTELSKLLSEASECLKSGNCDKAGAALAKAGELAKLGLSKVKLAAACKAALGQCKGGDLIAYGQGGPAPQESIPPNAPGTQLFAPRQSDNPGDLERVRAQINPEGPMMSTTEKGAPAVGSASRVPYYEVISDYSKTAEEALSKEEVPAAYRSTVRAYFRALQSGKPEKK